MHVEFNDAAPLRSPLALDDRRRDTRCTSYRFKNCGNDLDLDTVSLARCSGWHCYGGQMEALRAPNFVRRPGVLCLPWCSSNRSHNRIYDLLDSLHRYGTTRSTPRCADRFFDQRCGVFCDIEHWTRNLVGASLREGCGQSPNIRASGGAVNKVPDLSPSAAGAMMRCRAAQLRR